MRTPTLRQLDVLRAIADGIARDGYPPTMRELLVALGMPVSSIGQGITDHLNTLERKGCITRARNVSRSLRLTEAGYAWLGLPVPEPKRLKPAHVTVNLGARCLRCSAQTFDPDKPCFMCRLIRSGKAA